MQVSEISLKKRKTLSDNQEGYSKIIASQIYLDFCLEKKTRKRTKTAIEAPAAATDDGADNDPNTGKTSKKTKGTAIGTPIRTPDQLFDTYADADDRQTMGAEGFERLCGDADIPMEGARPLLLAWQLGSKELGSFSRQEWTTGFSELQIKDLESLGTCLFDLEELIVLRKPPPPKPVKQSISKGIKSKSAQPALDKYNKDRYWGYAADVNTAFSQFYNFCFALVKKEGSRNIDMEYACAFWSVILAPSYPIMSEIIEFINEKGTYKGVNKDLWTMMCEFCQTVEPSLEGYDSEGAWPTLLDNFVEWKKTRTGANAEDAST